MPENTQIQQLLAALPELFPGVQKIPLANIRLNPNNPGAKAAEEDIAELAANIALVGLKNAAKVMPDPAGPLAPGLSPHPDNFRLKADNTPWSLSDFRFLNLSGELRQLACQRLQWTVMDGIILNPTPEQAVEITDLDNAVRDKGWWAKYQSVEALIKANPTLKQREVATRLRIDKEQVNWALRLLPLLNTEARGVLVRNPYKPSKGNKGISESAAARLTALGPGTGLKRGGGPNDPPQAAGSSLDPAQANLGPPQSGTGRLVASAQLLYPYRPIPPETQDLVYRTLVVASDHQMKESQVQKLVESVQAGNPPETFGSAPKEPKAKALDIDVDKLVELAEKSGAEKARGDGQTTAQEELKAHLDDLKKQTASTITAEPQSRQNTGTSTLQTQTISRSEGLAILGQQIGKAFQWFFKPNTETDKKPVSTPPPVGGANHQDTTKDGLVDTKQIQKEVKPLLKWSKKITEWFVKIVWRYFLKTIHHFCKAVANYAVPVHQFEHYGRKHSGSRSEGHSASRSLGVGMVIPTVAHWFVYSLCQLFFGWVVLRYAASHWMPGLKPWVDLPFRFLAHQLFGVLPVWAWGWALNNLTLAVIAGILLLTGIIAVYKTQPARTWILAALIAVLWYYGRGWSASAQKPPVEEQTLTVPDVSPKGISNKTEIGITPTTATTEPTTQQPTFLLTSRGSAAPPLAKKSVIAPKQEIKVQPWNSTDIDKNYFEAELGNIPQYSAIYPFAFKPLAMSVDMMNHCLSNLQDSEKYSVRLGQDKQKVTGVYLAPSNFTVTFEPELGGLLGGSPKLDFYWEDVKELHCNKIETNLNEKNSHVIYQLVILVNESKKPLVVQCDSAVNFERLVSAFQFSLKNLRGTVAPISGLPYINQGLRLNGDGKVTTLWADSPADKAKLNLGDVIWSVDKNSVEEQHKTQVETALQSLTPGPQCLYIVTPIQWDKAKRNISLNQTNPFNPIRQKVSLQVQ